MAVDDARAGGDPVPASSAIVAALPADDGVPLGVLAFVVVATLAAIALGFAGDAFATLLDPVASEVFGG